MRRGEQSTSAATRYLEVNTPYNGSVDMLKRGTLDTDRRVLRGPTHCGTGVGGVFADEVWRPRGSEDKGIDAEILRVSGSFLIPGSKNEPTAHSPGFLPATSTGAATLDIGPTVNQ